MSKPHPSSAIVTARTETILQIVLDGATWTDIRRFVRESEGEEGSPWKLAAGQKPLSESQIRRYVARADKLLAENYRASRKMRLRRHIMMRRNLFAKCVSQGDMRAALACLDSEAKLTGLFEDELNRMVEKLTKEIEEIKRAHGNPPKTADAGASGTDSAPSPGTAGARSTAG